MPGQMLLTVMPSLDNSPAMTFVNPMIAVLGRVVVRAPGRSCLPVMPDTLSTFAPVEFFRCGIADRVVQTNAIRLRLMMSVHCSSDTLSIVPGIIPPTLLTRMSSPPSPATTSSMNLAQPSEVA